MTVAVLALQGAFLEHEQMLEKLGADYFEIRQKKDLDRSFDALILPGGESTVMRKLLLELDIYDTLKEKILSGLPVFGTCAGLILLANEVEAGVPCFGTMNITLDNNEKYNGENEYELPITSKGKTLLNAFIETSGKVGDNKIQIQAQLSDEEKDNAFYLVINDKVLDLKALIPPETK